MPARSFRIIFSVASGDVSALAGVHPCSDSPPALARSLWQVAQNCVTISACAVAGIPVECEAAGWTAGAGAGAGAGDLRASRAALGGGWNRPLRRAGAGLFSGRQPETESANHENRRQNVFHGVT